MNPKNWKARLGERRKKDVPGLWPDQTPRVEGERRKGKQDVRGVLSDREEENRGSAERKGMRYRKKPIVIEATQWFRHGDHPMVEKDLRHVVDSRYGLIKTLEDSYDGAHFVEPSDWIITGIKGEHYAIKPDIFAATYEPEDSQSDLARLIAENELLRKLLKLSQSGRHIHVAHYPDGDTCASCGQNFRSEVHFRDGESKKTDDALITAALKGEQK